MGSHEHKRSGTSHYVCYRITKKKSPITPIIVCYLQCGINKFIEQKGQAMTTEHQRTWDLLQSQPPTRLTQLVAQVRGLPYPATWREQQLVHEIMQATLREADHAGI